MMFHVGVLYRIGGLLEFLNRSAISRECFHQNFPDWQGVSGSVALEAAVRAGWVSEDGERNLRLTDQGNNLVQITDAQLRLRDQVKRVIEICDPPWVRLVTRGREAVRTYAPPEAVQCLKEAGLLTGHDQETVSWWDRIAQSLVASRQASRLSQGREGEWLSIRFEEERTGCEPRWVALDSVDAGYDLLSRVDRDDSSPLPIEVKASHLEWNRASFFITRNEWFVISSAPRAVLHLWAPSGNIPLLAIVAVDTVRTHIPLDQGRGEWRDAEIPFRAVASSPRPFK